MENLDLIEELWAVIQDRRANPKKGSYTNELLSKKGKILLKLREELSEIEESVQNGNIRDGKDSLVWEASDFIYHLLVLLASNGVELDEVLAELKSRR